jgi:hypothetical protein
MLSDVITGTQGNAQRAALVPFLRRKTVYHEQVDEESGFFD